MTGEVQTPHSDEFVMPGRLEMSGAGRAGVFFAAIALVVGGGYAYSKGLGPHPGGNPAPDIYVAAASPTPGGAGSGTSPEVSAPVSPHATSSPHPTISPAPAPPVHPTVKPKPPVVRHTVVPKPQPKPKPVTCHDYNANFWGINPNAVSQQSGGTQLISVVARHRTDHMARLAVWEKHGKCWVPAAIGGAAMRHPLSAQIGRNGMVAYARRQPGSATTPTGLFAVGKTIYGNMKRNPNPAFHFRQLRRGDWWVEAPSAGGAYDTFRHENPNITPWYGSQSEALWTVGQAYDSYVDIKMPTPPNNAAGIFLHHYSASGATEGCIALPDGQINRVLKALRPTAHPHMLIKVQS